MLEHMVGSWAANRPLNSSAVMLSKYPVALSSAVVRSPSELVSIVPKKVAFAMVNEISS